MAEYTDRNNGKFFVVYKIYDEDGLEIWRGISREAGLAKGGEYAAQGYVVTLKKCVETVEGMWR